MSAPQVETEANAEEDHTIMIIVGRAGTARTGI